MFCFSRSIYQHGTMRTPTHCQWKCKMSKWLCFFLFFFFFYFKTDFISANIYISFFLFYFIFRLYITVLVLPNIKMNPPQVENSLAVSCKVEHRLTIWLSYPIFRNLSRRNESTLRLGYESCVFRATFIITKYGRNPSTDEWTNKRWYHYFYTREYN